MSVILLELQQSTAIFKSLYFPFITNECSLVLAKVHSIEIYSVDENGLKFQDSFSVYDTVLDIAWYAVPSTAGGLNVLLVLTKLLEIWAVAYDKSAQRCSVVERIGFTSSLLVSLNVCMKVDNYNGILVVHSHVGTVQVVLLARSSEPLVYRLDTIHGRTVGKRLRKPQSLFQQRVTSSLSDLSKLTQFEIVPTGYRKCYLVTLLQNSVDSTRFVQLYLLDLTSLKLSVVNTALRFPKDIGSPSIIMNLASEHQPFSKGMIINFVNYQYYIPPPDQWTSSIKNPIHTENNSVYEAIKVSKINTLQRTTCLEEAIATYSVVDSKSKEDGTISYRILFISLNTLHMLGLAIEVIAAAKPVSSFQLNHRNAPIHIHKWDLMPLGDLPQAQCLHHINSNYFVSTSNVSNSLIFKLNPDTPHLAIVQYLNEFSNGPILDLEYVDNYPLTDAGETFQNLYGQDFPCVYSVSGSFVSSEFKVHRKGFNTIMDNCLSIPESKERWLFQVGDTVLVFCISNDLKVYRVVENESFETETIYCYNNLKLLPLSLVFDSNVGETKAMVCQGSQIFILFEDSIKQYNMMISPDKIVLEFQKSINLRVYKAFTVTSKSSLLFLYESSIQYLDFGHNIDLMLPLNTADYASLSSQVMDNQLYIIISYWLGDIKLIKSSVMDSTFVVKTFNVANCIFNQVLLDVVGNQVVAVATSTTGHLLAVKTDSIMNMKNGKTLNKTEYLKQMFPASTLFAEKSKLFPNLYYLQTKDQSYLLNLQAHNGLLAYDYGQLNVTLDKFWEFKHSGSIYLAQITHDLFITHKLFTTTRSFGNQLLGRSQQLDADIDITTVGQYEVIKTLSRTRNKSRKVMKTDSSKLKIDGVSPKLMFTTFTNCLKIDGLIRKFVILKDLGQAVLMVNQRASDSTIYIVNIKNLEISDTHKLVGYEALDIIQMNHKAPTTSETASYVDNVLDFEDKTSVGLKKMLDNKFLIITNCDRNPFPESDDLENVNEFHMFSVESGKIVHELTYKNSRKAQYYSLCNFGYRLFIATGAKTGIFRVNFKPSTGKFYIKKTLEKKIAKGFTNQVSSINNFVLINDVYHGPMLFKISLIKYIENEALLKDVYTVNDYAVGNKYEDFEMALQIFLYEPDYLQLTFSIASLPLSSFVQIMVDFDNNFSLYHREVTFKDRKLNLQKAVKSHFNIEDHINIMKVLPNKLENKITEVVSNEFVIDETDFNLKPELVSCPISPISLIGSATGAIYCVSIVRNKTAAHQLNKLQSKVTQLFQHLDKSSNIAENNHMTSFRSPRFIGKPASEPPLNFIDGGLFQQFLNLPYEDQKKNFDDQEIKMVETIVRTSTLGLA